MTHRTNVFLILAALMMVFACAGQERPSQKTFKTPEEAVQALAQAAEKGSVEELRALFGPEGRDLIDTSDPTTARHNRQVFTVAMAEGWRLVDDGQRKTLVVGNEAWPFPVPLIREAYGWRFDTATGEEEVIARRIGRNELAVISACRAYINAQQDYARTGHDGKPAGLYARTFASEPGKQNGLYWASLSGQKPSPLGELVAQAAADGQALGGNPNERSPFHGYYFKILTAQGPNATDGARDYVSPRGMSGGFALVAWPAHYDITGVMTFVVNQEGAIREKDLGRGTEATAKAMVLYDPDDSWGYVR